MMFAVPLLLVLLLVVALAVIVVRRSRSHRRHKPAEHVRIDLFRRYD